MLNGEPSATISQFVDDAKHIELLSEKGVSARLGLLLYGPPGTGKSLLAGHVAASLGKPFYIARLDSLISSRLGETAKNIRGVFEYVHAKKAVLFLDEMDAIAKLEMIATSWVLGGERFPYGAFFSYRKLLPRIEDLCPG